MSKIADEDMDYFSGDDHDSDSDDDTKTLHSKEDDYEINQPETNGFDDDEDEFEDKKTAKVSTYIPVDDENYDDLNDLDNEPFEDDYVDDDEEEE
jgi:hypothetical protein